MNVYKAEEVNNMDRYVPGQDVYNIYNNIRQWTKKFGLYQVLVASTNLEYSKRQCPSVLSSKTHENWTISKVRRKNIPYPPISIVEN